MRTVCFYHQNLELSRAIGYREGEIVSILNLGTTCRLVEQLDRAIEWHTLVSALKTHNIVTHFNTDCMQLQFLSPVLQCNGRE